MINSKLIRLLKALNATELHRLQDFVSSPYFNKKKNISEFVGLLINYYPAFDKALINKESIFKVLFEGEPYDKKRIGYLQSDLFKLTLQFLKIEKGMTENNLALAYVLAEKKLDKLYAQEIRTLNKEYGVSIAKGAKHYKSKFEIHDLEDQYFISNDQRKDDENAYLANKNLDLFYVCRKLQYFLVLLNRKQILGKATEMPQRQFILKYTEKNFLDNPIVKAYYEAILMQTKEKPLPHFFNLKNTILKHYKSFSTKEIAELYEEAINFCIQRISFDQAFYIGEALQLYMEFLDSGHMYRNDGFLSHWKFKNIIKLGLLLERFEYVEQFILKYIEKISPSNKTKALHYNLAELHFAKHDFENAQEHLSILFQEDLELAYILGSRMMLIKIFYQNKEDEALLSQIAAFTIFLKRSKIVSNTKKKIYLNFCNILNKILRQNPKHYHKIKLEIEQTKPLTDTNWLLKVYEELMPNSIRQDKNLKINEII